jgi:hypothetical protein
MSQGADSANLYHHVYKGLGDTSEVSSALNPQAIATHKKLKEKFGKDTMDRLEEIGRRQITSNLAFNEYYLMLEGDLAYTDYQETPEILKHVVDLRQKADIPSYVRHFDLIGQVTKHLQGKYNDTKNKFVVDFFDDVSKNEYDREFSNRIFQFTQNVFNIELELRLMRNGVSLKQNFESEEEQQQYMEYLEQQKNMLDTPPEIKTAMSTQWKPIAAKWAQKALERDRRLYNLDEMEREHFKDFFLTGRYFKHYYIGYDYYAPERWSTIETFFSQDIDIKYPQDGEYVGNIQNMAPSSIVNKFGHLMKEKDIRTLLNSFDYQSSNLNSNSPKNPKAIMEENFTADSELIPHEDYYDRQSSVELQSALGVPLGEETFFDSQGNQQTRDAWIPNYNNTDTGTFNITKYLRRDIEVREDTIRVTQAYWRSWDKIGLLYRENESGISTLDWVTDELDQEFLEVFDINKVKDKSLEEFMREHDDGTLEPNSICWTYAPRVWKGIKLTATNSILKKDLYLGVEPMELQIKGGSSNIYDVKLPVTGIITDSEAKKIRPYQIEYNYQMNLMHSLTEKEIGIFWLFDISLLPSDFEGQGDARETLLNVTDMARDVGLVPIDMSKQNMRTRSGQQFNSMQAQDISFVPQIQQKMQLAGYYKALALEQIGITEQDVKTPSEYSTAEGIKVGQQNSFSQIEHIFEKMDNARLKDIEIGLAVTQHCQASDHDISLAFTSSDEEIALVREVFKDENFKLRDFSLLPVADSKRKKELETFKQYLLSNNAIQNPLSDVAEVVTSDSFSVVRKVLKESERNQREQEQVQREHEKELLAMDKQAEAEKLQAERDHELLKQDNELANRLKVTHIQSAARVNDRNEEEGDMEAVNEAAQRYINDGVKNQNETRKVDLKEQDQNSKEKLAMQQLRLKTEELKLKKESNQIKKQAIKAKTFGDIINKN